MAETCKLRIYNLAGGFKPFLFSPLLGEDSHFDEYFSIGLKPPTSNELPTFLCKKKRDPKKNRPPPRLQLCSLHIFGNSRRHTDGTPRNQQKIQVPNNHGTKPDTVNLISGGVRRFPLHKKPYPCSLFRCFQK